MTFNVHQRDTERGIPQDRTGPTPSERFLLFRDLTFGTPLHPDMPRVLHAKAELSPVSPNPL
jgi:hypothetical protein